MYAVIDIGSNTMRLVLYKIDDGKIVPLLTSKKTAGLASFIENDVMSKAGMNKAIEVLVEFDTIIKRIDVKEVFAFATASFRNAKNSQQILEEIKKYVDFDIVILSGSDEGRYDYLGAIQSMPMKDGMLIDIGGGSSELVRYIDQKIYTSVSYPLGSLNLYVKTVSSIFPKKKEFSIIEDRVKAEFSFLEVCSAAGYPECICAVGGTARAINTLLLDLNSSLVEDRAYKPQALEYLLDLACNQKDVFIKQVLHSIPDRVHTIVPGLIILNYLVKECKAQRITTSAYGIREGYLYYNLTKRGEICGKN